jgi:hypothetical protein
MNDAIRLSREILNAHPTGVRSLFLRYGIGAEPDPRSIVLAAGAFGQAFINDLYALQNSANNYTGEEDFSGLESGVYGGGGLAYDWGLINYNDSLIFPAGYVPPKLDLSGNIVNQPVPATKKNTSFADFSKSFNNILGLIGNTVNAGANIYNTVKTGQTQQTTNMTTSQAQAAMQQSAAQVQLDKETAAAKNKQIMIIGGVLVVVVLVMFLIFRKR